MDGLSIRKADEADQLIMTAGKWKRVSKAPQSVLNEVLSILDACIYDPV